MKAFAFLFFMLSGLGSADVRVNQSRNKDQYMEGDSAIFQCSITFDTENVQLCTVEWVIEDPEDEDEIIKMFTLPKYKGRFLVSSNSSHSSMTLERVTTNDTDVFLCSATCIVNQKLKVMFGTETKLKVIFGSETKPKVKAQIQSHLIFAINLLIFIVATIICAIIIRNRKKRRSNTDE